MRSSMSSRRSLKTAHFGGHAIPPWAFRVLVYSYVPSHNPVSQQGPRLSSSSFNRPGRASVFLSSTFFIAQTQQQCFKLIKCLCSSGSTASRTTRSPRFKLALSTSSMLSAEKLSSPLQIVILLLNLITHRTNCRPRVQPELVDNFDFFAHAVQSGGLESAFVAIQASSMKAPIATPSIKSDSK
jgi:hypothetical protein